MRSITPNPLCFAGLLSRQAQFYALELLVLDVQMLHDFRRIVSLFIPIHKLFLKACFLFFLYFIYLFHLRSYLQYSLTDTYTHNKQWTSLQIKHILSFTVITTHYYIRVALVCNVLAPFLRMDGQLITRFGNHHFELVNHLNPSV